MLLDHGHCLTFSHILHRIGQRRMSLYSFQHIWPPKHSVLFLQITRANWNITRCIYWNSIAVVLLIMCASWQQSKSEDILVKFDPFCLHWSCSTSSCHAAGKTSSHQARGSNSNTGTMDQTWSTFTTAQLRRTLIKYTYVMLQQYQT